MDKFYYSQSPTIKLTTFKTTSKNIFSSERKPKTNVRLYKFNIYQIILLIFRLQAPRN